MMSKAAKNFAKFASKATPKHSFKAFSACPSNKAFATSLRTPKVTGLASLLHPIPPSLSITGTGIPIPSSFIRALSTTADSAVEAKESDALASDPSISLGSVVEACEDLEAILTKITMNHASESRFHEDGISIIVDFHAPWCGPCRFLGPALEQEVARVKNTVLVKVNVDEAPNVAAKFQVASLPTVMVFRNGKVINSFIGSRDKAFVKKFVEDL